MDEHDAHETHGERRSKADCIVLLQGGEITDCQLVPWGSNYTFAVVLEPPEQSGESMIGIYKPRAGEAPLWDFPSGTLYLREYAAYLVAQELGWEFIPHTVIRDGPHGIGTVQEYIEPEQDTHYFHYHEDHADELRRMAVFDMVTNNADRKAGHCFRGKQDRRIWGIDHGLTFNIEPKLRTVIWDFTGEPIPEHLLQGLQRIQHDPVFGELLRPYLDPTEIEAFRARARRIIDMGVFPQLSSRRNIPYGW